MCSLDSFPNPPLRDKITICEFESCFIDGYPDTDIRQYTDKAEMYPKVFITPDVLRPSASRESAKSAFLMREATLWKRIAQAWYEQGSIGMLQELTVMPETNYYSKVLKNTARTILPVCKWLLSLKLTIYPHLTMKKDDMIAEFVTALNWKEGIIRSFAWDPQTMKFAIAFKDDSIKVYNSPNNITPLLKHALQKDVTSMAWKPYCASMLALGCQAGVIIWQLDPTSLVTRPSSTCMTLLSQKGHTGVTSVSWHPNGELLASCSPCDTSMLIWDVAKEECTPLQRYSGGGVSLVQWSPDGSRLFAATPSSLFRVWETHFWTCEKWTKLTSRCQAACWSSDGAYLIFANKEESVLYLVSFEPSSHIEPFQVGGSKSAIPIADLSAVTFSNDSRENYRVGGCIQNIAWDKMGERLAVSFKESSLIVVFRTKIKPTFEINPCGFIRGPQSQSPQLMEFHHKFAHGALLAVCWSNGVIIHTPMLFIPSVSSPIPNFSPPRLGSQLRFNPVSTPGRKLPLFSTDSSQFVEEF